MGNLLACFKTRPHLQSPAELPAAKQPEPAPEKPPPAEEPPPPEAPEEPPQPEVPEVPEAEPLVQVQARELQVAPREASSKRFRPLALGAGALLVALVLTACACYILFLVGKASVEAGKNVVAAGKNVGNWVGSLRLQVPQINVTRYEEGLEGAVNAFAAAMGNISDGLDCPCLEHKIACIARCPGFTENPGCYAACQNAYSACVTSCATQKVQEGAKSAADAAKMAYAQVQRQRMQVTLPMMFGDASHYTDEMWAAMQELVHLGACFDIRRLACELLIDQFCDCDKSLLELDTLSKPVLLRGTCVAGPFFNMIHSREFNYPPKPMGAGTSSWTDNQTIVQKAVQLAKDAAKKAEDAAKAATICLLRKSSREQNETNMTACIEAEMSSMEAADTESQDEGAGMAEGTTASEWSISTTEAATSRQSGDKELGGPATTTTRAVSRSASPGRAPSGQPKDVEKSGGGESQFQRLGLEVGITVQAKVRYQFIPRIDLTIGPNGLNLKIQGQANVVCNFSAEVAMAYSKEVELFRLPKVPAMKGRCVSYFCILFSFQASVLLSVDFQALGKAGADLNVDFDFLVSAAINTTTGEHSFTSTTTKITHWEEFKFHASLSPLTVALSFVPGLTLFTVPGAPITLLPAVRSEIKFGGESSLDAKVDMDGHTKVESHHEGQAVAIRRLIGPSQNNSASNASVQDQEGTCEKPPGALNIILTSPIKALSLPKEIHINFKEIALVLVATIKEAADLLIVAIQRMTRGCEFKLSNKSIDAIRQVASVAMGAVDNVFPKDLDLAFPDFLSFEGHPPFCWTVSQLFNAGRCGAGLGCPDNPAAAALQPIAKRAAASHVWPHGNIAMKVEVKDCDIARLEDDAALRHEVEATFKESISRLLDGRVSVQDTEVHEYGADGVCVFRVTIYTPLSIRASDVQLVLNDADAMARELGHDLGAMPQAGAAFKLPLRLECFEPALQPCPTGVCHPADNGTMKSHGIHSVCRADAHDNTPNGNGTTKGISGVSHKRCMDICNRDDACTGAEYEYTTNRCEIWTKAPQPKLASMLLDCCRPFSCCLLPGHGPE